MPDFFETDIVIGTNDADASSRLSISGAASLMQYLATVNSRKNGYDRENLVQSSNGFWIVSKIRINFKSVPKLNDKVHMKTWEIKPGRIIIPRDFEFSDMEGNVLFSATSEWCILDLDTHRPRRLDSTVVDTEGDFISYRCDAGEFNRLRYEVNEADLCFKRTIRSSDIDENGHTNNVIYSRIVTDCFTTDFLHKNTVSSYELHFISESREADELLVYKKEIDGGFYIQAVCGENTVIKAFLTFCEANYEKN